MNPVTLTKSQSLLYALIQGLNGVDDKVKLAKLAYFADFIHYAFHDKPISEETTLYQRRDFGPLSVSFNSDLKKLVEQGYLSSNKPYHFSIAKNSGVKLTDEEQKTVDYVLSKYSTHSFDVLADISHKQVPYLSATEGGIIDYNTAYNLVEEYSDYA